MTEKKQFRGTWVQRAFVIALGIVLGVLLFWFFGFITSDISSMPGPDFSELEAKYVDAELVRRKRNLQESLNTIREKTKSKQEQQQIVKNSTESLQDTISQLLSIQKQAMEKNLEFPAKYQQAMSESQALFLDNQKQYQALNEAIAELTEQRRRLNEELASVSKKIERQVGKARKEYGAMMRTHRLRLAALKLGVMIPIFLLAAWLFMKKRSGTYWPMVYAIFAAAFVRICFIVHEYFPRKYLKYVALVVIIAIIVRLLVHLISRIVSPKEDLLIKQYQEAYDRYVCPICSKPIRIGPLRYAIRHKRKDLILLGQGSEALRQQIYTCPACGTPLYEKCQECADIRHSLLPFCEHCGYRKAGQG